MSDWLLSTTSLAIVHSLSPWTDFFCLGYWSAGPVPKCACNQINQSNLFSPSHLQPAYIYETIKRNT